ncbi:MAG TPA: exosortase/archaeosortase family protein [Terriglobales bacterium]|jgi:exosortase|nr:exosortase/archaeosortase family protein [Terriglobales bacterium]
MASLRDARFPALIAGSVLVAWHPLLELFKLTLHSDEYTQILLVLPISIALISVQWRSERLLTRTSFAAGGTLLSAAIFVAAFSRWGLAFLSSDFHLMMEILAVVIWWIGSFVLCFGTKVSRAMLFPLCFLFWIVPLPAVALNELIKFLQYGSARAAEALFAVAGVPVVQNGLLISIPDLTVQVAKECSSIRSSLMLVVTTMVLAYLLLRSPWRRLLVIAISLPLSIAKNGLRIFTIAILGTRVDPGYLNGRFHHQGGIVFFAISLLIIFLLLWVLQRGEKPGVENRSLKSALPC